MRSKNYENFIEANLCNKKHRKNKSFAKSYTNKLQLSLTDYKLKINTRKELG